MNVHAETQIKIEFANGMEFTPVIVFEGVELENPKSFSSVGRFSFIKRFR